MGRKWKGKSSPIGRHNRILDYSERPPAKTYAERTKDYRDEHGMIKFLSQEEAEELRRLEIEKSITPELLTHFTKRDAFELCDYFSRIPSETTQGHGIGGVYGLDQLTDDAEDYLERHIRGRKIIEFGDAGRQINKSFFLELGATGFETADPQRGQVDGLTYLMRQPDESAIVCSFGVLDDGVLHMGLDGTGRICSMYTRELAKEIYRVTPKGTITLHGTDSDHDLREAGFVYDDSAPKRFLEAQYDITVLIKT